LSGLIDRVVPYQTLHGGERAWTDHAQDPTMDRLYQTGMIGSPGGGKAKSVRLAEAGLAEDGRMFQ
jgi:hypothetical protein